MFFVCIKNIFLKTLRVLQVSYLLTHSVLFIFKLFAVACGCFINYGLLLANKCLNATLQTQIDLCYFLDYIDMACGSRGAAKRIGKYAVALSTFWTAISKTLSKNCHECVKPTILYLFELANPAILKS